MFGGNLFNKQDTSKSLNVFGTVNTNNTNLPQKGNSFGFLTNQNVFQPKPSGIFADYKDKPQNSNPLFGSNQQSPFQIFKTKP